MTDYKRLDELCDINMGQSPASESYNEAGDGLPFFQGNADFGELYPTTRIWCNAPTKIVEAGTILISVRAPIGALNYSDKTCCIGRGLAGISPKKGVESKYIYYCLKSKNRELNLKGTGSTFKAIAKSALGETKVKLVSEKKQNQIVNTLDTVSKTIQLRRQQLSELDNLIKSRFVEMFGNPMDFSRANTTFTNTIVFNPKKSEVADKKQLKASFVPMEYVGTDGSFSIQRNGTIDEFYKGYTYFKDNDVLIAKITPCFENGKSAIAKGCTNGIGFGTTEFHVARPIEGKSTAEWIQYLFKNNELHNYASTKMAGAAGQKRIQTPFFEELPVYLPPYSEQVVFSNFVTQVNKSKFVVQKSLDELQILYDSLMQKYFG